MDLSPDTEEYIKESIESSFSLPVSVKTLSLKLIASEDARHRLQDQIFVLEERLMEADKRLKNYKAEANMNAQGVRRCVEEKEVIVSKYGDLMCHCRKLEEECFLYELDLERTVESCDELGKENEEMRARLNGTSNLGSLCAEIESLKTEKELLRINLNRAEEEVKVLFEENIMLNEDKKRLLELLKGEKLRQRSDSHSRSANSSAKGKRKSSSNVSPGRVIDFSAADPDPSRQPFSPLHHNSPESRMHKK